MSCNVHPSAEQWREIAAMNARIYAMSDVDAKRWWDEHPVSLYNESECGSDCK